jgi:hypothetical protein
MQIARCASIENLEDHAERRHKPSRGDGDSSLAAKCGALVGGHHDCIRARLGAPRIARWSAVARRGVGNGAASARGVGCLEYATRHLSPLWREDSVSASNRAPASMRTLRAGILHTYRMTPTDMSLSAERVLKGSNWPARLPRVRGVRRTKARRTICRNSNASVVLAPTTNSPHDGRSGARPRPARYPERRTRRGTLWRNRQFPPEDRRLSGHRYYVLPGRLCNHSRMLQAGSSHWQNCAKLRLFSLMDSRHALPELTSKRCANHFP